MGKYLVALLGVAMMLGLVQCDEVSHEESGNEPAHDYSYYSPYHRHRHRSWRRTSWRYPGYRRWWHNEEE